MKSKKAENYRATDSHETHRFLLFRRGGSILVLWILIILAGRPSVAAETDCFSPEKEKEPRIYYSGYDPHFSGQLIVSRITTKECSDKTETEKMDSPNKIYWYIVCSPDTLRPGPWTTRIIIFNERDYFVVIALRNHAAQYETKTQWINEKLLYIQWWWGRVLGSYMIYDVEKEKIVVREMIHYGKVPYQKWRGKGRS